MSRRKIKTHDVSVSLLSDSDDYKTENHQVVSRLRRRLLRLNKINRNPDELIIITNSPNDIIVTDINDESFLKTELTSVKKHHIQNNRRKSTISKSKRANITNQIHCAEATQKQDNCNVNLAKSCLPQIYGNYTKNIAECDNAADNNVSTVIAPTEQLNDSDSSICNSRVGKLPDTRLACGEEQETLSIKQLDCVDEPEPLLCTQDLVLESTQTNNDQSEIQWDYRSPELVKEVKQLQGQYGMEEIRRVVSNFSNVDVKLQKHIIPELRLYLPVKSDSVFSRNDRRQKAKARAQQKVYGRESVEDILKWLENKAAKQLSDSKDNCESSHDASIKLSTECSHRYSDADDNLANQNFNEEEYWHDEELFTGNSLVTEATQSPELYLSILHNQISEFTGNICDKKNYIVSFTGQQADDSNGSSAALSDTSVISSSISTVLDLEPPRKDSGSLFLSATIVNNNINNCNSLQRPGSNKTLSNVETAAVQFRVSSNDNNSTGCCRSLDIAATHPHGEICSKPLSVPVQELGHRLTNTQQLISPSGQSPINMPHTATFRRSHRCIQEDNLFIENQHSIINSNVVLNSNANSLFRNVGISDKSSTHSENIDPLCKTDKLLVKDVLHCLAKPAVTVALNYGFCVSGNAQSSQNNVEFVKPYSCVTAKHREAYSSSCYIEPCLMQQTENVFIPSVSLTHDNDLNMDIPDDDDFQMLLELEETLYSQTNSFSTSAADEIFICQSSSISTSTVAVPVVTCTHELDLPKEKTSVFKTSLDAYQMPAVSISDDVIEKLLNVDEVLGSQVSTISTSGPAPLERTAAVEVTLDTSAPENGDFNVSISYDDFQLPLEVDETLDSQAKTISTSASTPSERTAAVEVTLDTSFSENDDFNVSIFDDDFQQLLEVDETVDSQASTISTSASVAPARTAAYEAALGQLHGRSSDMTPNGCATENDDFYVSMSDDDFQLPLKVDETLDSHANTISTSASTPSERTAAVEVILDTSFSENDDFNVSIFDDDFQQLLEVDEAVDSQASTISTSASVAPVRTTAYEAALDPLHVPSDMTPSGSETENDDFNVCIFDDDFHLLDIDNTLNNQVTGVSTSKTTAFETLKTLQVQPDMILGVSATCDNFIMNTSEDDFQMILEDDETLDYEAGSILTSKAGLPGETAAVEATLDLHVSAIENDDFYVGIFGTDFQQLLEVDKTVVNQASIISTSASVYPERTAACEAALGQLHIQSDMTPSVSTTEDDDFNVSISDDDFENLLLIDETSNSQANVVSSSKAVETTLMALQVQPDRTPSVSTIQDNDFNIDIPDDDFQLLLEADETLGRPDNVLSTSAVVALHEKTAAIETSLYSLQIQSDIIQTAAMTQDDDANIPDDDFEQLMEIDETLNSQANILSARTSVAAVASAAYRLVSGLCNQITSDCKTLVDARQIQRPSIPKNNDITKKLTKVDETLHGQTGSISTPMATVPGVVLTPVPDNKNTPLSETSFKTLQIQSSANMNINKLTYITDGSNRHDVFTSGGTQLSLPKLTESLSSSSSSSRAMNNIPANVNSPRRFRFKKITSLQKNSHPYMNMQACFLPRLSDLFTDVRWSTSNSISSTAALFKQVETSVCSQAKCSPDEIEQKRQAALQKRSLRLSQLKN